MVSPHVFMGAMNKKRFVKYLKRNLLPVLNRGDLLVMDNLSSHKVMEVENLLRKHGVKFLYLPGYSPDLNPIELSFSKLKSILRKEKIRDVPTLQRFLLESRQLFTKQECKDYFKHERYTVHKF